MSEDKFNELYNNLLDEQCKYMSGVDLTSKSFDSWITQMVMNMRSKILLLGNESLSSYQMYELLGIPDQVLLKVTRR